MTSVPAEGGSGLETYPTCGKMLCRRWFSGPDEASRAVLFLDARGGRPEPGDLLLEEHVLGARRVATRLGLLVAVGPGPGPLTVAWSAWHAVAP